jgi:hypothetical protein
MVHPIYRPEDLSNLHAIILVFNCIS